MCVLGEYEVCTRRILKAICQTEGRKSVVLGVH